MPFLPQQMRRRLPHTETTLQRPLRFVVLRFFRRAIVFSFPNGL
jgi:hypothetical protein